MVRLAWVRRAASRTILVSTLLLVALAGCSGVTTTATRSPARSGSQLGARRSLAPRRRRAATRRVARDVYAATESGRLAPAVHGIPERVYVPDTLSGTVDVIDPASYRVVRRLRVGESPQHIAPAWDLRHLFVDNTYSNTLTVIDPATGKPTRTIPVEDPYNLYFTPDGRRAIVVSERRQELDFRTPHAWRLIKRLPIPGHGVDHLDFTSDGRLLVASDEFSGDLVEVDVRRMRLVSSRHVGGLPVDVRLAPDGAVFYVANQGRGGVSVIDPHGLRELRFIPTGAGAHGLYVSRDTKLLYVANRLGGSISVIDFARRRVVATWPVGGSPDMLQLSPDGRRLWTSNRFGDSVSVIDTGSGRLLRTIAVGASPHGLAYFPAPGRFSLGHDGVYR